jgi:hypothetical protein
MSARLAVLAPATLLFVGCDNTDEPHPLATPTPAAAATLPPATATLTATVTPTPEPPLEVVYYQPGTLTGIPAIDEAITAAASGDAEALAAHVIVDPVACTTAEGLGGPPKCPGGAADGTLLTRFGVVQCEGGWAQAEHLAVTVERWITPDDAAAPGSPSLYAIVFIDERFPNMPGDYYVIFGFPDGQGRSLSVTDGGITFLWFGCGPKPVEQWPPLSATVESRFLLPPLGR